MSALEVACSASVTAEGDDYLTAGDLHGWLNQLPDEAKVSAIIRDRGTQRDPMRVLVGLTAKWSETR